MSNKNNQKVIEIESITLNKEDLAIIDSIIGQLAYKVAKPIYDIIQKRMQEAANVVLEGQQRSAQLQPVKEEVVAETMAN